MRNLSNNPAESEIFQKSDFIGSGAIPALPERLLPYSRRHFSGPLKTSTLINAQGQYASFIPKGDIRRFAGETLTYDIDFLFFDKAATAKVRFFEHKGKYFSTLTAETKGVVGFFTNYRKHYYKAAFDIVDEGRRVQTSKFERDVIIGKDKERTVHFLDYASRTHFWFLFSGGNLKKRSRDPIPEEAIYDDILAFFTTSEMECTVI